MYVTNINDIFLRLDRNRLWSRSNSCRGCRKSYAFGNKLPDSQGSGDHRYYCISITLTITFENKNPLSLVLSGRYIIVTSQEVTLKVFFKAICSVRQLSFPLILSFKLVHILTTNQKLFWRLIQDPKF